MQTGGSILRSVCAAWALFLLGSLSVSFRTAAAAPTARVINGQPSTTAKWPWVVSVGYADTTPDKGHFCGGVLIGPRHVLTAGHCAADFVAEPYALAVTIGRLRLTSGEGQVAAVDGIVVFPGYVPGEVENDLAIIRLKESYPGPYLPLVGAEDAGYMTPGTGATILGWGMIDPQYEIRPDNLQEAQVPIAADADCEARLGLGFKARSMLCAGKLATSSTAGDGVDACYGDSGGPLVVETPDGFKLGGLVSWGFACGSDRYWGVYTRIAVFADWVNSLPGIAPYAISGAYITGRPELGSKLTCRNAEWAGDPAERYIYEWHDVDEGLIKRGTSPVYRIRKQDIGRSLYCAVHAEGAGGGVSETPETGAIYPVLNRSALSRKVKKAVSAVGTSCRDKRCSMLLTLNNSNAVKVSAVFVPEGRNDLSCADGGCFMIKAEKGTARELTADTWLFSSRNLQRKNYNVYLRIIYPGRQAASGISFTLKVR